MENITPKKNLLLNLNRYKDLDALRGIAALMVVFFHFAILRPEPILSFFWGRSGVDMFFIISGFVIFMSINKVENVSQFAINRFSRLFPTYWFCVTLTAATQFIALKLHLVHSTPINISWLKYFANLSMFQNYFGYDNIDGPYWTLLVEMLFYIGIAFLLKLNKIKNIFNLGCVILIVIVINNYLENMPAWPFKKLSFWLPIFNYYSLFFSGILFYKLLHRKENKVKLYLAILACYLVQMKIYSTLSISSIGINFSWYTIILALIFGIFLLFVNNKMNFITNKITMFLGKISYSLYLIHQYIGVYILMPGFSKYLHFPALLSAFVTLAIIITLAYLINKFIEVPAGKLLKTKINAMLALRSKPEMVYK